MIGKKKAADTAPTPGPPPKPDVKAGKKGRKAKKGDEQQGLPPLTFTPSAPSVDLLPSSYRESVQLRRVRKQATGLALAAVIAVAGLYAAQEGLMFKNKSDLEQAQNEASVLAQQTKQYLPIQAYLNQITSNTAQVATNMSKDSAMDGIYSALLSVPGVNLLSVTSTVDVATAGAQNALAPAVTTTEVFAGCPQVDLFDAGETPAVGCLQVTGEIGSREALSAWLSSLEQNNLFISPFVSGTTATENGISFTASIGLTTKAYSFRYSPEFVSGTQEGQ